MSNYVVTTNFTSKDALASGNPAKVVKGADLGLEFTNIASMSATKYDSGNVNASPIGFASGSSALPGIAFASDLTSGLSLVAAGDVGLSVAGVKVADFQAATIALFNSAIAGVASLNLANTSVTATQDAKQVITAGSSAFQAYIANQNRASAVLTGGPTTAQVALATLGSIPLVLGVNGIYAGQIKTTGGWVIPAATADIGLAVTGAVNQYAATFSANATSGQSFGMAIIGGTTSADSALTVANQPNTVNYFQVRGDGKLLGNGPIAAALVDMTPDKGTFTETYATGFTTNPTATCSWSRNGNQVTLFFPVLTATSNATGFTITGLPAAIQPAQTQLLAVAGAENAGSFGTGGQAQVTNSGTITMFFAGSSSSWTNSGVKGIGIASSITYLLN